MHRLAARHGRSFSVVRRLLVARVVRCLVSYGLQQAIYLTQLRLKQIQLLLLAKNGAIQFIDVVFAKSELCLKLIQSGIQQWIRRKGLFRRGGHLRLIYHRPERSARSDKILRCEFPVGE